MVRGVHTPAKGPLRTALHLGAHLAGTGEGDVVGNAFGSTYTLVQQRDTRIGLPRLQRECRLLEQRPAHAAHVANAAKGG